MEWLTVFVSVIGVAVLMNSASASHFNITPSDVSLTINPSDTKTFNFRVTPGVSPITANMYFSTPFSIVTSDISLNNLGTFKDIVANVSIPAHTLPGDYKSFICVVANETNCLNLILTVPRTSNFTVESIANITVNTSSKGYMFVNLTNSGNTMLNISISSTSPENLQFLHNTNLTTFPGFNYSVPLLYSFPNDLGVRNINITLKGDQILKIIASYINVSDTEIPKLVDIKYNSFARTTKPFTLNITTTDNVNVSYAYIRFDRDLAFNLTQNTGGSYNTVLTLFNTTYTNFSLVIIDTSNNNYTQILPITVDRLGGTKYFDYNPVEILHDFKYQKVVFTTENEIPLNLSLLNFNIDPANASYTISITGDTVSEREVKPGTLVSLDRVNGSLYMNLISPNISEFKGEMIIFPPDYVADNHTIKITGRVGDFNIIESKNIIIGLKKKECSLDFRGDLYNSSYICKEVYPVAFDFNEITIEMTQREYNEVRARANAERDTAVTKYNSANMWRFVWFFLFTGYLIFSVLWYRMRMTRKLFAKRWFG